jgi:poly-gamma-glutamate synthesis protein (capsule biosynthesis protein)
MKSRLAITALLLASCATGTTAATTSAPTTTASSPTTTTAPVATTTTLPSATTALPAPSPRERIVIHGVGDIALCNCFHRAFRDFGFEIAFSGMNGAFRRDALTIGNLECAAADGGRVLSDKKNSFRCDTSALSVMAAAGFDVAAMGNNHSADYGFEALLDARRNLEAAGLHPVGAGANIEEATRAAFFERGGWTIAVVSFSEVSGLEYRLTYPPGELINPWFAEADTPGIAPARFQAMTEVVSALDQVTDIVIVSLHQGSSNDTGRPTDAEVRRGHALVDAGADIVIAHHHHRLLPLEVYRERPIFWGMGNFVWARLDTDLKNITAVAEIVVESDGSITGRLVPAYIESHGHPVLRGILDPGLPPEHLSID